jgi:glycosyltransferase involved in cell wall biosynthesis
MKKMKVYIQYPWKFSDSSFYKYLRKNPPKNIVYIQNKNKDKKNLGEKRKFIINNIVKKIIRKIIGSFFPSMPNAHLTKKKKGYDIIHCAHCLSKNNSPWVADFEYFSQMWVAKNKKSRRDKIYKILLKDNCKKIMPWTKYTKKNIIKTFPKIKNKVELVYPAIPKIKLKKIAHEKITLIYVARYFKLKGGLIALETLSQLQKKHGIRAIVVSDVPEELKKKYRNLEIYNLIPQEKLFNLMAKSDIFLYPSFFDSFGLSILEAMSIGLPIVTINSKGTKALREIVKNGKHGFVFDVGNDFNLDKITSKEKKIIQKLVKNCSKLVKNPLLLKKMSQNCKKEVEEGKFSITTRNRKLNKIYIEALK